MLVLTVLGCVQCGGEEPVEQATFPAESLQTIAASWSDLDTMELETIVGSARRWAGGIEASLEHGELWRATLLIDYYDYRSDLASVTYSEWERGTGTVFEADRVSGRIEISAGTCSCRDVRFDLWMTDFGPDRAVGTADDRRRRLGNGLVYAGPTPCLEARVFGERPLEAVLIECASSAGSPGSPSRPPDRTTKPEVDIEWYPDPEPVHIHTDGGCEGDSGGGGCEGDDGGGWDSGGDEGCDSGDGSGGGGDSGCDSGGDSGGDSGCDSGGDSGGDTGCESDESSASCEGDTSAEARVTCSLARGGGRGRRRAPPTLPVLLVGLLGLRVALRRRRRAAQSAGATS